MTVMPRKTWPLRNGQHLQIPPAARTWGGTLVVTLTGDVQLTILDPAGNIWFDAGIPGANAGQTATVSRALNDQQPLTPGPYTVTVTGPGSATGSLVTSSP